MPIAIDWNAGRAGRIDLDAALALFHDFGFRSIGQKLAALVEEGRARGGEGGDGASTRSTKYQIRRQYRNPDTKHIRQSPTPGLRPLSPPSSALRLRLPFTAHLVDTPEAFESFLAQLRQQKSFSLDTETTSVWPRWAKLVGMSLAWNDHEAWYLPLRAPAGEPHLDAAATLAALKPILEDPTVEKIGQNLKYDMIVLRAAGIELAGVAFDTMVASYLLEAGRRNHNLDELAQTYLHHETIKISELIGTGKDQRRMDEVPIRRVADYAGEDAWLPLRLRPILAQQLDDAELTDLLALARTAADRRAGRTGVQRHQGRRGAAGRAEPPLWPSGWRRWRRRSTRWPAGG